MKNEYLDLRWIIAILVVCATATCGCRGDQSLSQAATGETCSQDSCQSEEPGSPPIRSDGGSQGEAAGGGDQGSGGAGGGAPSWTGESRAACESACLDALAECSDNADRGIFSKSKCQERYNICLSGCPKT